VCCCTADGGDDDGWDPMATHWTEEIIDVGGSTVPARIYGADVSRRPAAHVLHLHGGAFIGGSLESGRGVASLLADAGAIVVSIDYPRAPERPFPHALQATFGALHWLHKFHERWGGRKFQLLVAGEEAGGNLAASVALMARDQQAPPLAGQILLSPMLDPRLATCSMRQAEAGPVGCKWADGWHEYLGSADKAAHPYAVPPMSSRFAGLAPALVLTANDDVLRDESLSYARRLREAGVAVDELVLPAPTGWPCALGCDEALRQAWATTLRDRFSEFFAQTLEVLRTHQTLRA
jgi:acetyl esterase